VKAEALLKVIESDNLSGAAEILHRAKDCLITYSQEVQSDSPSGYLELMADFGQRLAAAQPSMAPLFNYVNKVLLFLEDSENASMKVPQLREEIISVSEEFITGSEDALRNIERHVSDLVETGYTIMTHSYSSTVIGSLINARINGKDLLVIVPESRPALEGRRTAKILSERGIRTKIIADMASFGQLKDVDMVLVGCDTICKAGIVNKIGTLGLAITAKNYERPFYVAGERSKFLPSIYQKAPKIEMKDPQEILDDPGSIEIDNVYFDITPYEYITGIVTHEGMMMVDHVDRILDGLRVSEKLME
jgi:eIF-2B alpha/beta/delta-like uncharacterized protein